ncbi:MAG: DUF4180 domain-containing protein [Oscillospiraceae bacterium]|jgi:hypothetical protein|nr:DUF4180 domain-containing protein [Oscillospiraceae bacterium]
MADNVTVITENGRNIALLRGDGTVISDGQSALDFLASVFYEHDCRLIAIPRSALAPDFFRLATGVAGEVAQKISNYRCTLAVYGDFSEFTSKPLRDFMYESNNSATLFFVPTEDDAIKKLAKVN